MEDQTHKSTCQIHIVVKISVGFILWSFWICRYMYVSDVYLEVGKLGEFLCNQLLFLNDVQTAKSFLQYCHNMHMKQ